MSSASLLHPIDVYVGRFKCIHCIALHCIFSFSLSRCHWPFPLVMVFFYFVFVSLLLLLLLCYLAAVAQGVVCLRASHISLCRRGSIRRRRISRRRRGWRNVSWFSSISQRNAGLLSLLSHFIFLAYFSGEFEWLLPSGVCRAVVVAKLKEIKLASHV